VAVVELEHASPKMNVFCGISRRHMFGPFFCMEMSVTGQMYLKMLQNLLMPQVAEEEFIFQQDGAPPHWHMGVLEHLSGNLPGQWTGHASASDVLCTWPSRSPDLTVCDFFL
jgi:hypothetical protein